MNQFQKVNDELILKILKEKRISVNAKLGIVWYKNKILGWVEEDGYRRWGIHVDGRKKNLYIHRIIWISVNGIPLPHQEINHKFGDKSDCRIGSLELTTHQGNCKHAWETGLVVRERDGLGRFRKKETSDKSEVLTKH